MTEQRVRGEGDLPAVPPPMGEDSFAMYNTPGVYAAYVRPLDDGSQGADLIVNGIHCASCVLTIEKGLRQAGVRNAQVNFANHRASVAWDDATMRLGDVLRALKRIGYDGHPYDPDTQERLHRTYMRKSLARLGVAGFGAANVMLYSVSLYAGYFHGMDTDFQTLFQWISALITLPVVLFSGMPFLQGAWAGLRQGRFNMDSLISTGILVTFIYSWVVLLTQPGQETFFDSVTMIVFFLLIGRFLETLARGRTGNVVEGLMGLRVKWAIRLQPGATLADSTSGAWDPTETHSGANPTETHGGAWYPTVPVADMAPGDLMLVRVGDAVPLDGTVHEGASELDESALTGESRPRPVQAGDAVWGGAVNTTAPLIVRADTVGAETVLARICAQVEEAQRNKAPMQRMADFIAGHFVWVILLLAGAVFGWWQWLAPIAPPQAPWIIAISMLIIACPCALGLATPVAVLAGSSLAAAHGVLIKGGEVLERAAKVTDVVLDKTGTLTAGQLEVRAIHDVGALPRARWLAMAAAIERNLVHPIARAIQAQAEGSALPSASDVRVLPGLGARGMVDGTPVLVGNAALLRQEGITLAGEESTPADNGAEDTALSDSAEDTDTLVYVAVDGAPAGLVRLHDPLRPDAAKAVQGLHGMGIRVHLFSGDRPEAVAHAAAQAGISDQRGAMLPQDKMAAIAQIQAAGGVVAMVGDGINDAPALTQADLAVAVGTGSDLALEAAQVILLQSRLEGTVMALRVARRTFSAIRQNLALSLAYNAVAIPLAAMGFVIPLLAAIAMSSSSLLVVGNALRLRLFGGRRELPPPVLTPGGACCC